MRLFYYCNFPAPYYIGFLNELGKLCELTVVFERAFSSERDSSWKKYTAPNIKKIIILHGIHTQADMAFCPQIIKYIDSKKFDKFIIHDPASPTGMWLIWYMKIRKIPYILQCEGTLPGDGKTGFKEKYKTLLLNGAKCYLSSMNSKKSYFSSYIKEKEKIKWYPFSSFYQKDILKNGLNQIEKNKIRKKLGIKEKKVILSVGSIIKRKGHDILLKACRNFSENIGIYIISGKATKDLKDIIKKYKIKNVHFVEFMPMEELWNYYKMADILAVPTREDTWGLFVNEAMANGLPIITTKKCVAGLELIDDGKNGYLIDTDDVNELRKKIIFLLKDWKLREMMAENNIKKIREYTFENEAKKTFEAVENE